MGFTCIFSETGVPIIVGMGISWGKCMVGMNSDSSYFDLLTYFYLLLLPVAGLF